MFWAALVASGVAIVSMTLFGAWFTRNRSAEPADEPFEPSSDPSDPWAAYRPRPFEEVERPRPRLWPVVAALTGLVLVGGGIAGARQNMSLQAVQSAPTPRPYVIEYEPSSVPLNLAPTEGAPERTETKPATPKPEVSRAVPDPTVKPVAATAKPVTSTSDAGAGPTISGSASCSGGTFKVTYSVSGTNLSWVGVYVDKKSVKGGPISGESHSSSYSQPATPGDHEAEVTAEDRNGGKSRKFFQAHCA